MCGKRIPFCMNAKRVVIDFSADVELEMWRCGDVDVELCRPIKWPNYSFNSQLEQKGTQGTHMCMDVVH